MNLTRASLALLLLAALVACGRQTASPEQSEPAESTATASPQAAVPPDASTAPVEDTPTPSPTRGSRTYLSYESEANGFSIDYPEEWQVSDKESMPGTTAFVAPLQGQGDSFRENVSVVVQTLPAGTTTLDKYTEMALAQGQEYIPLFAVQESRPTTLGSNPAQEVVYTGLQGEREMRWLGIWALVEDRVYILTYTAEDQEYTAFRSVVQQMIRSVQIR
jgi:hypothetical protein